MPQPPVTILTNYASVGGPVTSNSRFTWGQLRFPLGFDSTVFTYAPQSATYDIGFTTTDSSLFRHDFLGEFSGLFDNPPTRFFYVDTPPTGEFRITAELSQNFSPNLIDADDQIELTGQLVTMTSGTFTTTSDFYTNPPAFQTVASSLGTITSIGNLATF